MIPLSGEFITCNCPYLIEVKQRAAKGPEIGMGRGMKQPGRHVATKLLGVIQFAGDLKFGGKAHNGVLRVPPL